MENTNLHCHPIGMKNILCLLISFVSFSCFAQHISGLYSGTLVNDSTKKVQRYELALSEYKDKITGYSYTTFVVNDTFYYSIKRVKGEKKNGQLVVEDVKMLANNFPESPAKGVHQINTIPLPAQDTLTSVDGIWTTTKTKVYYSLSGSVAMKRDNDSSHSALLSHLTELRVISPQPQAIAVANKPQTNKSNNQPTAISTAPTLLPYGQRATRTLQAMEVTTDSLVLSFYDNGVVDGDTISVYLNNEPVLRQQQLTARATRKTIYLPDTVDSTVTLTLVAENLGTLPPNTGLLIIQDGTEKYQVNFSADLQTNAAIVFRKKKNK